MRRAGGFALVESLVGLALSLFVISTGVEFFALAQRTFSRLKTREEADQAAAAAVDRMRIDLLHAGRGLARESAAGLVEAVLAEEDELRTTALDGALALAAAAPAGTTRLALAPTADIAPGREIALRDGTAGEVRTVVRVEPGAIVIDRPLDGDYDPSTATVSLLETVAYRLDPAARVLRRRVNGGSAQPVLESTAAATWSYDRGASLLHVRIELGTEGAHAHETTVFVKNAALARNR